MGDHRTPARYAPFFAAIALLLSAGLLSFIPTVEAAPGPSIPIGGSHGTAFDEVTIASGEYHTCVIKKDSSGLCWGENGNGQSGNGNTNFLRSPASIDLPTGKTLKSLDANYRQTCGIMNTGELYCWGNNPSGALGDGTGGTRYTPQLVSLPAHLSVVSIGMGESHTCAIMESRSLWCWGSDSTGQLSYEDSVQTKNQNFPIMSKTPTKKVRAVTAGYLFTCIISHDYDVWCAGTNSAGQLGDASTTQRHSFVQTGIPSASRVIDLDAGYQHSCALLKNSQVWCWGDGGYGQLGDKNTTSRTTPVLVQSIPQNRTAVSLSMGWYHSCAILDDGNVTCWGSDSNYQSSDPVLPVNRTAVQIAGSSLTTCILLNDSSTTCWGRDYYLGINSQNSASAYKRSSLATPIGLGVNTTALGSRDMDGDGFTNVLDNCHDGASSWTSNPTTDHDNDGCEDSTEDIDDDEDGFNDTVDACPLGSQSGSDHDRDGCFNSEDLDDDNDGLNDTVDSCSLGLLMGTDHDSDGCMDAEDGDDDGDGMEDGVDACPMGLLVGIDSDGDGCFDAEDRDDDDDAIMDENDQCRNGTMNWYSGSITDHDSDGCQDQGEDLDDDNDGLNDTLDQCPLGLLSGPDHDQDGCKDDEDSDDDDDGRDDINDACPRGMRTGSDQDGDGCTDAEEGVTVGVDVDIDPGENCTTPDPSEDPDGDGCGNDEDYDDDGDGVADSDDRCPLGHTGWRSGRVTDWDADGCRDLDEDLDDDDDGLEDTADLCPTGRLQSSDHDLDGCSDDEDADDDNDGVVDLSDACPRGLSTGLDTDGDGCKDNEERVTNIDVEVAGTNVSSPDVIIEAPEVATCDDGNLSNDHDGDGCSDASDSDDDGDGVADADDFCPRGMTGWISGQVLDRDGDGCHDGYEDFDDDGDSVEDQFDACANTTAAVPINESGCYWFSDSEGLQDQELGTVNATTNLNNASQDLLSTSSGSSAQLSNEILMIALIVVVSSLLFAVVILILQRRDSGPVDFQEVVSSSREIQNPSSFGVEEASPSPLQNGTIGSDGYEWLEHGGKNWYRSPNSGSEWAPWQ